MTDISNQATQTEVSNPLEATGALPDGDIFLRTLIEVSTDAVVVVDREGHFRYTNPAYERLTGYTTAEMAGQPFFMVIHPDDQLLATETFAAMVQDPDQVISVEIRLCRKDGATRFVEATSKALPGGDFVGYLRDITRHKQAAVALRESEARFRTLVEISSEGIALVDTEAHYLYVSPAFERFSGYTQVELLGQSFIPHIYPDDLPIVMESFAELITGRGTTVVTEQRFIRKDGAVRFFNSISRSLPNGQLVAYVRDITEHKLAEERLRESEALYRSLSELSADGIMIMTLPEGRARYINSAYTRLFGYTLEDLPGQNPFNVVVPEDLSKVQASFAAFIASGLEVLPDPSVEFRIFHQDGSVRVVEGSGRLLPNGDIVGFVRDITERKQAEEKLRRSEAYYRSIIENATDGLTLAGNTGTLNYVSPSFERLLGYSATELVGQSPALLMDHADLEQAYKDYLQMVTNPGHAFVSEGRLRHKNGEWRFIESSCKILPSGEILGNFRDITERKQIENALRAIVEGTASATGADFFQALVKHLAQALGVDHAFVAETREEPPARVQTLAFYSQGSIVPNIEYALAGTPCEEVVAGQVCYYPVQVQVRFPNDLDLVKLGAESYMGMPLIGSAGKVLGHVAVLDNEPMRDEARRESILKIFAARAGAELERQRAETRLRELNTQLEQRVQERTAALEAALAESRRLAAIIEAMPDYVGMADSQGNSLYVNQAGRRLVGKPPKDDGPWNVIGCYPPEELPRLQGMFEAMQHGETWSGETVMLHRDGHHIPVDHLVFPLHKTEGQIESYAAVIRDITERKRTETELQHAKEAAEAATQAKSDFLASMSHELRTPLTAIIGYTELLQDDANDLGFGELLPKLNRIHTAGSHLLSLINDILDFSKIEAGKMELYLETFDLAELINNLVATAQPLIEKNHNRLQASMAPDLGAIQADQTRLRQVLLNLLSNAAKFTEAGTVTLSVEKMPVNSGGGEEPGSRGDQFIPAHEAQPACLLTERVGKIGVGSSRVDLQACKLEYSIVSPK